MHRVLVIAVLFLSPAWAQAQGSAHYYVQLVLATDSETPPLQEAKLVGPKLARRLNGALKPKGIWEVQCREVDVHPGRVAKVSLNDRRAVEIQISDSKRIVTTYCDGKAVIRTTLPRKHGMTVIGDGGKMGQLWFVVVRRDKPST